MTILRARRITSIGAVLLVWGGLALMLTGCAGSDTAATPNDHAKAAVVASEASLAAAGKTILACYSVPRCNLVAPKPQLKAAYGVAYDAVTKAQAVADSGGTPDMTATTAAMTALQNTINALPPQ
jgi:hypothetical protein